MRIFMSIQFYHHVRNMYFLPPRLRDLFRAINVQVAHLADRYSQTAAAHRLAPRRNSLTPRAEVVSRAITAVQVVPAQDRVTALHAQARPQFSVAELAWQPTATKTARLQLPRRALCPASAFAFRIWSRSQNHRLPFRSLLSTRQRWSIPGDVLRGGRSY